MKTIDQTEPSQLINALLEKIDPIDKPFIDFWKSLIPEDFEGDSDRKLISLDFELSGIKRGQKIINEINKNITLKDKIVLDIGSGNGGMCIAAAQAGAKITFGVETDTDRILLSKKWAECHETNIIIKQGIAEELPFENSSIDIVFLWAVIEHVESHDKTIAEIYRVLRSGGYIIIAAPNILSPELFISDPHYQTVGVSLLPRAIAKWWIVKIKKLSKIYGVGTFPIYSVLVKKLKNKGFSLITSEHQNIITI